MADIFNYGVPLKGLNTRLGQELELLRNNNVETYLDENLDLLQRVRLDNPYHTFTERQLDFALNQPHSELIGIEGLGDSSYDEDITLESELQNLEDTRARMQSNLAKIGNGVAKGAILAGTTFLDGTLGLLVGLPTAIGEGRFSGIWDNDFSKAMQAVNEASEEWLPNYYTQQEKEEPWYENIFTANFLGDKFIKNLGFTIGAFGSGNIASLGLKAMKIPQAVRAFQGAKAMKAYRDYRAIQKAGDALDTAKALTKFTDTARKASQMPAMVTSTVGATVSAINEGRIEALNNSRDWFNTQKAYIDDYYYNMYGEDFENSKDYQDTLIKLSDDRAKMGNLDMLMNVPILMASNLFLFGRLYANGFKTSKHAKNIIKKNDLYDVNMSYGKNVIGKTLADAAAEGTEEVTQKMAATISGLEYEQDIHSFVENKEDKNAEDQTIDWMKAFAQGINDTVNDSSTWEEFFIGALTGALGMPRFRSTKDNSGKIQSPIYFDGGIWGNHKQYREDLAREKEIANYLNNRVQSPEFLNYYRGFIRHKKYDNEMDKAAEENKPFEFKNAEHSQLLSDIIMFDNAGKLEDLNILIDNAFDTSDENLQSIVENTSSSVGEDVVGPFMEGKNPMYATEEGKQKMIDKLTSTRDLIKAKILDYLSVKSEIEFMTDNQLSDDLEEELIHMLTSINDWLQRHNEMSDELRTMLSYSTKAIHNKLTELNEELHTGANNRPRRMVEKEILDLEAALSLISGTLEIGREHYSNLSRDEEMLNLLNGIIDNIEGVNEAEKQQAKDRIQDLIKVNEAIKEYQTKLKEYIANPQKQAEAQTESKEKKKKVEQAIKNEEKVEEISNMSVSDINASLEMGDFSMEELDEMFPKTDEEELSENQRKVQEVKNINTRTNKTKQTIDNSSADSLTKKDAKRLLDKSKQLSNSELELLDLDSEVFNDINNLLTEGESLPNLSQEDLEFILNKRLEEAKTLLSEVSANVDEEIKEAKKYGTVVRTFGEEALKPSGKDGQDTQKPINAAKPKSTAVLDRIMEDAKGNTDVSGQPLTAKVKEVLNTIDNLAKIGSKELVINDIIKKKTFYKEAIAAIPALEQRLLEYIKEQVDKFYNKKLAEKEMSIAERLGLGRELQKIKENIPPVETSKQQLLNESNSYKENKDTPTYVGGMSLSWFSGITEYPIHLDKGDFTTLETWVDNQNYSEQVKNRIKAVWNYLKNHNAFDYISNNNLKVGDKITFGTDNALNKEIGETIIIIYKKNSNNSKTPIGVLRPKSEANLVAKQAGLAAFIEQFEEAWEKAGMPVDFYFGETTVNNNLIGRVAFEEDGQYNTLNTIAQGKPFTLGIAVGAGQNAPIKIEAGRRASLGLSAEEQTILTPLDAVSGKPYLLIETSDPNRKYMPVAISMPRYSAETANSRLGRAIEEVLSTLPTLQADKSLATKESLKDLIYFHDMFIQVKDGNLIIKTKDSSDSNWVTLYTGPQNNPNLIEIVKKELYNRPFLISRKYINEDYKDGQSYNEMIGELAETNVAIGRLHTINDWFTINPVGVKRAPSFETTGNNPHYATPANVEINYKGSTYTVDLATFGENNPSIPLEVKAMAYVQKNNLRGIINTPFGWFSSSKNSFVQSPVVTVEESSTLEDNLVNLTIRDYTKEAKSKGLLGDKVKEKIWELLNDSLKQALLDSGGRMPQLLMDKLKRAYDARTNSINEKKLGGTLDEILSSGLHREVEYSEEEQQILNTAPRDSQGRLLAPNGKPSNLTERQYIQVRTKAFIDWFGDWINPYNKNIEIGLDIDMESPDADGFGSMVVIRYNGEYIGTIPMQQQIKSTKDFKFTEYININGVAGASYIEEEFRGKGLGKAAYWELGMWLSRNGSILRSAKDISRTEAATRVWKSLERDGFAKKVEDRYEFINNASKVVDKNGEPLVLYHRTDDDIKKFELDKSRHGGFWFSKDPDYYTDTKAKRKYAIPVFLNIRYPNVIEHGLFERAIDGDANIEGGLDSNRFDGWITKEIIPAEYYGDSREENIIFAMATDPNQIKSATDNVGTFSKENDNIRYREGTKKEKDNTKQIEKELVWLSKVLPNLNQEERVRIVEGLIRISQTEDKWAYGRFKRGIIEIGTNAARGTVYHEAFHAVVHTLLNDLEYESLFNSAKDKYGDLSLIELEEKLAEDFRRYTQINEIPVIGSIAKFFGRIKNIVKSLLGKDVYIDNLFYRINNQYYADRTPLDSNTIRNKEAIEANVQVTLDSWVNNRAVYKKGPNSVEAKNKLGVIKDNYQRMGYKVITKYNPRTKNVEVVKVIPNAYNREVEQYHKEKNWFGKLSEENKLYILDRGISIEEYNKMSPLMKEVLFHCK